VGEPEGSETAKLLDDIVRMLIPQALALSLPEYSESGDNGELPPLPGPLRVAELVRAEFRQLRIKSTKRHDITMRRIVPLSMILCVFSTFIFVIRVHVQNIAGRGQWSYASSTTFEQGSSS
jgi:hypothetical protein